MPANLFVLIILIFIGCASKAPQIESKPEPVPEPKPEPIPECQADEFRGFGVGTSDKEALVEAYSALARQINSSIYVTIERIVNQQVSNGKENLNSEYGSRTVIESVLPNAHTARIAGSRYDGYKINVVVCMSKSDAAKGFIERQRLVTDSLEMVSSAMLGTEHPKHKNKAWRKAQMLWGEFMRNKNLLEDWGLKSPYSADEIYYKTKENYKNYCQGLRVFWQDAGNECSSAVFATLSKKIKIEKSQCSTGLNLRLNCLEKCLSSPYGVECSYEPSLAIESCGGESYSLLKAKAPMIGSDIYNEAKAREKLAESLTDAIFLDEWEKDVSEWVPQCVD